MKSKLTMFIVMLAMCVCSFFVGRTYSPVIVNTSKIDSIEVKIDTVYKHTTDTIRILNYQKIKVDSISHSQISNITKLKSDTSAIKKVFDSTFVKSSIDSLANVGYSQIYGALVVNSKYMRDSAKLSITETQLSICGNALDSMYVLSGTLADTARSIAKQEYNRGYVDGNKIGFKTVISVATVATLLGLASGIYLTK